MIALHNIGVDTRITDDTFLSIGIIVAGGRHNRLRIAIRPSGFVSVQRYELAYWGNSETWHTANQTASWATRSERARYIRRGRAAFENGNIEVVRLAR